MSRYYFKKLNSNRFISVDIYKNPGKPLTIWAQECDIEFNGNGDPISFTHTVFEDKSHCIYSDKRNTKNERNNLRLQMHTFLTENGWIAMDETLNME